MVVWPPPEGRLDMDFRAQPVVLTLTGEFDLATAEVLSFALAWLRETYGSVVVDVAGISFIDSTGAAPLLDARRSWPDAVQLRGDNPPLNRLLTALELARTDPAVESTADPTAGPPETRAGR